MGAVTGLTPDDVRRQAEEIAAANELMEPFRVLRGIECDILPDGRLDLPDDVLGELEREERRDVQAELDVRVPHHRLGGEAGRHHQGLEQDE